MFGVKHSPIGTGGFPIPIYLLFCVGLKTFTGLTARDVGLTFIPPTDSKRKPEAQLSLIGLLFFVCNKNKQN